MTEEGRLKMAQTMYALFANQVRDLVLPDSDEQVMPGIKWGHFDEFFTPAYWATQAWMAEQNGTYRSYKLGETLIEEIAACLLGGFGMASEMGMAAFRRIRDAGILSCCTTSEKTIYDLLREPLNISGRHCHYRYPKQRSKYLHRAIMRLNTEASVTRNDTDFRNWLLTFPGIGPKTASWITRNWLNSRSVAVIDIHIHRAGLLMGIFSPDQTLPRYYFEMEQSYLILAEAIGAHPAVLDNLMWQHMRRMNGIALEQAHTRAVA